MGCVCVFGGAWGWEVGFCEVVLGLGREGCEEGGEEGLDGCVRVGVAFDLGLISVCRFGFVGDGR